MTALPAMYAKLTNETISEFERTRDLLDLACPTKEDAPFFNHCMGLAKEMGMGWEEGLRYTIEQRRMVGGVGG